MNKNNYFYKNKKKKLPKYFWKVISLAALIGLMIGFLSTGQFTSSNSSNQIYGIARIIDGDTIAINRTRIRFHGIDAPEINQSCWQDGFEYQCGQKAKNHLTSIINGNPVTCQTQNTDRYGRKIAKCFNSNNEDIEALMVSAGMAVAYTYYSKDYVVEEMTARLNNRGIWAGEFENPYDYRRRK